MSDLYNVSGDGKNIPFVIDTVIDTSNDVTGNRNEFDDRVDSPDENVVGAYARIHGDPIFAGSSNKGNTTMNSDNNSVVGNKGNNTMNSDNKILPRVKGDENNFDYRVNSGDRNVVRHHAEIIGNPRFGVNSGNSSKIDDESNDRDKKVGGTTGR